jgi:hypothetical protein
MKRCKEHSVRTFHEVLSTRMPRILKKRKASTYIEEWEDTLMGCVKRTCELHLEHVPPMGEL